MKVNSIFCSVEVLKLSKKTIKKTVSDAFPGTSRLVIARTFADK